MFLPGMAGKDGRGAESVAVPGDRMDEFERVQERLTKARPDLSPTLGRAAAYMLEHPADVVTMSMREIASASDIPAPNFSRLAERIGFSGYDALRGVYRRRIKAGKPIAGLSRAPALDGQGADDGATEIWELFRQAALGNIGAAFSNVDSASIEALAQELRSCEQVHIAATYASHHIARYVHAVGAMASPAFRLVGLEGAVFGDGVVDIGGADALICLEAGPSREAAVRLASLARRRGALVVGITESRTTPMAAVSDRLLLVPSESPSFFETHVGVLAVAEMLVGFMAKGEGEVARDRIRQIEAQRDRGANGGARRGGKGEPRRS